MKSVAHTLFTPARLVRVPFALLAFLKLEGAPLLPKILSAACCAFLRSRPARKRPEISETKFCEKGWHWRI